MHDRIVRVAVTAVLVAMVLFAVPLAVAVRFVIIADERGELERAALQAAVHVGPSVAVDDPVELPSSTETVGVYDRGLVLRAGQGPVVADDVVRAALSGRVSEATVGAELVVAVPVTSGEVVVGVVRAALPVATIRTRTALAWLALALLAAVGATAAVLTARRLARQLSTPLEDLARTSAQIAAGDLTVRAAASPVAEIARVADAHNLMVDELAASIDRARRFSTDASHQLRTPLSGLQLGLEAAQAAVVADPDVDLRPAVDAAARQADILRVTVDDLLHLSQIDLRQWHTDRRAVADVVADAEQRHRGPLAADGRALLIRIDASTAELPGRATGQILDVLLDNARQHGTGEVIVAVRDLGIAVAIDVTDEGHLSSAPDRPDDRSADRPGVHGQGLKLAEDLAETSGGRLSRTSADPTTFTVIIPTEPPARLDPPTPP